jgi:hypothetical protein
MQPFATLPFDRIPLDKLGMLARRMLKRPFGAQWLELCEGLE